jgi:hypothetical protein
MERAKVDLARFYFAGCSVFVTAELLINIRFRFIKQKTGSMRLARTFFVPRYVVLLNSIIRRRKRRKS